MLNFVLTRNWIDYDDFSSKLAHRIKEAQPNDEAQLANTVRGLSTAFFSLNKVDKEAFIRAFPWEEVLAILRRNAKLKPLTFIDIFEETGKVSLNDGKNLIGKLSMLDERVIQDAIRDSLREKNATNAVQRLSDSSLEVADHEHFSLNVKGAAVSFVGVVKGYKSVSAGTVTWKDIAHQITKAYNRTNPDHVLLVLAKNPADTLISEATEYGRSAGNINLVIVCDPVTLARFLKSRDLL